MLARISVPRRKLAPRLIGACSAAALLAVAGCGGGSTSAGTSLPGPLGPASGVVEQVMGKVSGLNPTQTAQGMGGILGYAQKKLPPNQFSKIAAAFPGSDALIDEGTKLGMPSEATGITSLRGTLGQAGISPDQFNDMVPAMTDIVREKSGTETADLFAGVFK